MSATVNPDEAAVQVPGRGDGVSRRRALVVGIDRARPPTRALGPCAADARRMAAVLRGRGFEVTALDDGRGARAAPTRAAVVAALDALTAAADEDDLVVVYVAGHGRRRARRPYLLLADTPGGAAGAAAGGLPLAELLARLRGRARWVAIFLDVVNLGLGLDPTIGQSASHGDERGGGFALLAGTTTGRRAPNAAMRSTFSTWLLEGLAGAAVEPDGGLRFSALARYVQAGVARSRSSPEGSRSRSRSPHRPVLRLEVADLQLFPARDHLELCPRLSAAITCAAFSPDGRRLVTGSDDGTVRLWDPLTGTQVHEAMRHEAPVHTLSVSRAGFIASASTDNVIKNWELVSGESMPPITPHPATVHVLLWTGHGVGRLIAASNGLVLQSIKDLALGIGRPLATGAVLALAEVPAGVVAGGVDGKVRWFDAPSERWVVVGEHHGPVAAVAVSPDGRYVAAGVGHDAPGAPAVEPPRLWDRGGDAEILLLGHPAGVNAIAYAPDGTWVATTSADGIARIFDAPSGRLRRELTIEVAAGAEVPAAYAASASPDGRTLFVGYGDGRGRLYALSP